MFWVVTPPVSANNFQTWFFMHFLAQMSEIAYFCRSMSSVQNQWPTLKATGTWGITLKDIVQGKNWLGLSRWWNSMNLDFPNGKHLFVTSLLAINYKRLLKFPPLCRNNLQCCFSRKKLTSDCLCFSCECLSCFYSFQFLCEICIHRMKEAGILEVLESKLFFIAQSWWEGFYKNF